MATGKARLAVASRRCETPAPTPAHATPESLLRRRRAAAALRDQGRLHEALAEIQAAVAERPADADAQAELGLTWTLLGRYGEAEPAFRAALATRPDDIFSLSNLAGVLKHLNRHEEAEALFRRTLEVDPNHAPALWNLAVLLKDASRFEAARATFAQALKVRPTLDGHIQAHLALTPMVRSEEDIAAQRMAFASGLEAMAALPGDLPYGGERVNLPWYYLAYHDQDDSILLARTAQVMRAKVSGAAFEAPHVAGWSGAEGRRIRVGICSEFLYAHTIGRLYRGLVAGLDRRRFEVVVLHSHLSTRDAARDALDALADRAFVLPAQIEAQRRTIADLAFDVLFYPDVGMSAPTWFLAQARLAPVQVVSWGHPDTTGIPTLDYFISSDALEPPGAEAVYTERLIRFSRLPCAYEAPGPPIEASRRDVMLPPVGTLYGCPQTLFKMHPDFDAALAQIAAGDPDGHIILIAARTAAWTDVLKARWAERHPILLERVTFLSRLTHDGFMAHLRLIDVLLDPLHFGSGNTLYEGISVGAPIVTWPGRFMRGRIVAAAYAQMGLADAPVAATMDAYADTALTWGGDPARRARFRAEVAAKAPGGLYGDSVAVREFEAFFSAAVEAAATGERLPSGWRPG